ncbi:MAG: hypothetical protein SGPRY_014904, partial [Prymnesium sp.]
MLQRVSMHTCIAKLEAFYETEECFYIVMEFASAGGVPPQPERRPPHTPYTMSNSPLHDHFLTPITHRTSKLHKYRAYPPPALRRVTYTFTPSRDRSDLFDHVAKKGPFSEPEAAVLMQEIGCAIALLHAQGMVHADVKPENILLTDDEHVKLVDFGLSCEIESSENKSDGTLAYWAPELFSNPKPARPMDMWALGLVLFYMLTGEHPFDEQGFADNERIQYNIRKRKPDLSWWAASNEAKKLALALLRKDPEDRLTIEQLLQHPWIVNGGVPQGRERETLLKDGKRQEFQRLTAKLRAACFA